jgi:hypothetical protein
MVAAYAAHVVGDEFRRGSVATTYLRHPSRGLVAAAHAVTYAAVGAVLAAILAGAAMAVVLPVAAGDHINTGLAPADIALVLAGLALGGAERLACRGQTPGLDELPVVCGRGVRGLCSIAQSDA